MTIRRFDLRPEGVVVTLMDGSRRLYRFGLVEPADIAQVTIGGDSESIVIELRSGEVIERSLDSMEPVTSYLH